MENERKGEGVGDGVGTGKGTGKSMRTRLSKLRFSKPPFNLSPIYFSENYRFRFRFIIFLIIYLKLTASVSS